jgi:hypothetical protein
MAYNGLRLPVVGVWNTQLSRPTKGFLKIQMFLYARLRQLLVAAVISCAPHTEYPYVSVKIVRRLLKYKWFLFALSGFCVVGVRRGKIFCFFKRQHFTFSSIRLGGWEICKLMWRQNKYLPLKKATTCACNMCDGLNIGRGTKIYAFWSVRFGRCLVNCQVF